MKKIINIALFGAVIAWMGVSCTQEIEISKPQEQGIPVVIRVDPGTRAIHVGNELDRTVETLRVLIYGTRDGALKWNFTPEELDEHLSDGMTGGENPASSEVPLKIRTGVYDFVYIANEGDLSDDLDALTEGSPMTALQALKFDGSAFTQEDVIPMVSRYPAVTVVLLPGETEAAGVSYFDPFEGRDKTQNAEGTWEVVLERVGIRLRLEFSLRPAEFAVWDKKITIDSIAGSAWLLSGIDNSASQAVGKTFTAASGDIEEPEAAGENYTVTYDRIILPELLFTPADTPAKAMDLSMTVGGRTRKGTIAAKPEEGLGYTLPRNTYLAMTVEILQDDLVFTDIRVIDWGGWEDYYMTDRGMVLPQTGILAPPGVLGINSVTGELTLRGSKEYKNTAVATRPDKQGTVEFGDISKETVYVAYFKWGSLIGMSGGPGGDVFDRDDIGWAPMDYGVQSLFDNLAAQTTGNAKWDQIPSVSDGVWPATPKLSEGLGDPCAFADGGAFEEWKTPAGDPWGQDIGAPFGSTGVRGDSFQPYLIEENDLADGLPAGMVKDGTSDPDWSMFLPLAGIRDPQNGEMKAGINFNMGYWGATSIGTTSFAVNLKIHSGTVYHTQSGSSHKYGYAIRCVRKMPKITITPLSSNNRVNFRGGEKKYTVFSIAPDENDAPWEIEYFVDNEWTKTSPYGVSMPGGDGGTDEATATVGFTDDITSDKDGDFRIGGSPTGAFIESLGTKESPYDLSTENGARPRETANCYIVNNPGWYKLPLVYGNAVRGGSPYHGAYRTTDLSASVASGTSFLANFVRHDGKPIDNAYIQSSSFDNGVATNATLVWQDSHGLVEVDTWITGTGENAFLTFSVSEQSIAQGNALVAVRNAAGEIMWSWHIWVTPRRIASMSKAEALADTDRTWNRKGLSDELGAGPAQPDAYNDFMKYNLGWNEGRIADYAARTIQIRAIQTESGFASEPVTIEQSAGTRTRRITSTFWQWGRKDPIIPVIEKGTNTTFYEENDLEWGSKMDGTSYYFYTATPDPMGYGIFPAPFSPDGGTLDKAILNPHIMYMPTNQYGNYNIDWNTGPPTLVQNLWSMNNTVQGITYNRVIKTVYDPCPVGFSIPHSGAWTGSTNHGLASYIGNGDDPVAKKLLEWNVKSIEPTRWGGGEFHEFYLDLNKPAGGATAVYFHTGARNGRNSFIGSGNYATANTWDHRSGVYDLQTFFFQSNQVAPVVSNLNRMSGVCVRPAAEVWDE